MLPKRARMLAANALALLSGTMACGVEGAAAQGAAVQGMEKPASTHLQRITVADVARQAIIGDPHSITWSEGGGPVASTSADGQYMAVVVRRGNPERGTNDAEILIYKASEVLTVSRPLTVARFASATNYQPIALLRWLQDSRTLVFAATDDRNIPQIYRASVQSQEVVQLTREKTALQWYDITPSGQRLVILSEQRSTPLAKDPDCLQHGCRVTGNWLYAVEQGIVDRPAPYTVYDLATGESRSISAVPQPDLDIESCKDDLKGGLSPDGRFGLRICALRPHRWPAFWSEYTADAGLPKRLAEGGNFYARQLLRVDFESGLTTRLTDAPFLYRNISRQGPVWIDGGSRVVLAGAFETLQGTQGSERTLRKSHLSVLSIDPATGQAQRIGFLPPATYLIVSTQWDQKTQTLTIDSADAQRNALPVINYRRVDGGWRAISPGRRPPANEIRLIVEQSLNHPPKLVAVNDRTHARRVVLDPNPWLADRGIGRVEAIQWNSKDQRIWHGALYFPPDYAAGQRYPVVLQTHGINSDQFSLHGASRNFAAQPIAAAGMLVLQITESTKGAYGAAEWPTVQWGYEAAIDHLDALGMIDRNRVGIVGWSRSGPYAGYTLTHSTYRFAAAAFTPSADLGWWYYLSMGAPTSIESDYGAAPFGEGLDAWQRMSPSFNLDRVDTPVFMWVTGSVGGLWDWYIGLRRLSKPVDYWLLPDGVHDIFKVNERMVANQLLLDWFRFWLQGEEDADIAKTQQYAAWRQMRERSAEASK